MAKRNNNELMQNIKDNTVRDGKEKEIEEKIYYKRNVFFA